MDKRETRGRVESALHVGHTEQVGKEQTKREGDVQEKRPDHRLWNDDAGIFNLFRYRYVSKKLCLI